jgi:TonB family protein
MSVLAYFKKSEIPLTPLQSSMELESDRRLYGCMISGSMLGMAFVAYAMTLQVIIHIDLYPPVSPSTSLLRPKTSHITDEAYRNLHPRLIKRPPLKAANGAHTPRSRSPAKDAGTMVQKLISSQSTRANLTAYDLIGKTLQQLDMDKLSQVTVLTRSGQTRISGRPGKKSFEFNYNYYVDGKEGKDSKDIEMPGTTIGRLAPTASSNGSIKQTSITEILSSETTRSSSAILAVIRAHSPGLRHVYNAFLRTHTGMKGKVTLKFAIAPSGQVVDVEVVSSSTEAADFDSQVMEKVKSWRFEAVKAKGNDIVTVPFNFSE